jgi:hypothetical protein
MAMRHGVWLGLVVALAGCSWLPFTGESDGPHLSNAAVDACKRKAGDMGLDAAGERLSTPGGEGRYTVVLDVRKEQGFSQITCTYDPAKGAEIQQPKAAPTS